MCLEDAFALGFEAYNRGDGIDLNPYDDLDAQHEEWADGWHAGQDTEGRV